MRTPPTAVLPRQVRWFTGRGGVEQFAVQMPYPSLDGSQACAGREDLFLSENTNGTFAEMMGYICDTCPFMVQCREWALAHEGYGFWGGTTPNMRVKIRRERGQVMVQPHLGNAYGFNDTFFPELQNTEFRGGTQTRGENGKFVSSADLWEMEGPDV